MGELDPGTFRRLRQGEGAVATQNPFTMITSSLATGSAGRSRSNRRYRNVRRGSSEGLVAVASE